MNKSSSQHLKNFKKQSQQTWDNKALKSPEGMHLSSMRALCSSVLSAIVTARYWIVFWLLTADCWLKAEDWRLKTTESKREASLGHVNFYLPQKVVTKHFWGRGCCLLAEDTLLFLILTPSSSPLMAAAVCAGGSHDGWHSALFTKLIYSQKKMRHLRLPLLDRMKIRVTSAATCKKIRGKTWWLNTLRIICW